MGKGFRDEVVGERLGTNASTAVVVVGSPCEYGPHAAEEPLWGIGSNDTHAMEWLQTHLEGGECVCVHLCLYLLVCMGSNVP